MCAGMSSSSGPAGPLPNPECQRECIGREPAGEGSLTAWPAEDSQEGCSGTCELQVLRGLLAQQLGLAAWEEAAVDGMEAETLVGA